MNTAETLQPFCSLQSDDCLKAITEKLKVSELEMCEMEGHGIMGRRFPDGGLLRYR